MYLSNVRVEKWVTGQRHHREAELRKVEQSSKPGEDAVEEGYQGYEDHEVDNNSYHQAHSRHCTPGRCLEHIGVGVSEETRATL